MRQNTYEIEKNIEKILRNTHTGFLTNNLKKEITNKLRKNQYKIFSPFKEAEKVILYTKTEPNIKLYKIKYYKDYELKHSSIMGSLFGLNITSEMFGDIIKWHDEFYIYILESISSLVEKELTTIGNIPITLEEVNTNLLTNYERTYDTIELIVSSLRLDTITSKLISCNRDKIESKIKNKEIYLNDIIAKKSNTTLKENDTFSIRKYGKYRFNKIIGKTKKNNLIIEIDKYI